MLGGFYIFVHQRRGTRTWNKDGTYENKVTVCAPVTECSHLPGYISGKVAVGGELEVATVSSGVVHHIDLSRLEVQKPVHIETDSV